MGVLKHDGTVVNLDALDPIYDTNANGFGPETTRNPDMASISAGSAMPWAGGYKGKETRSSNSVSGRSGVLPAGNAPLAGVTRR